MARPLLWEVAYAPGTTATVALLAAIFILIRSRNLQYSDVGLSYERFTQQRELYRVVSSQLSHIELLHLLFNVSSTWSLRTAEADGLHQYLLTSLILMLLSAAVYLAMLHILIHYTQQERYRQMNVVGYSCVVFGWMTILSARGVAKFSVLGMAQLPMGLAPFGSLLLTSVIFPRASFLGHLSGILVGYTIAAGLFDWLSAFWLISLAAWGIAMDAWPRLISRELTLPGVVMLAAAAPLDVETGLVDHIEITSDL
ncbi:hypothetical protein WJX73_006286 [Symbiochloris irregularis]|uniref:Peptidase S54 rhomboid domain-containing protein n=1 Tax=Symbiochloris irregularis TaxID=706552 RepID=A0AAW1PRE8_9CHLO